MKRICMVVVSAVLAAAFCYGQGSTSAAAPAAVGHGAFPVKVTKTLDSSKLKEGDAVEVETAGSFKLPDGTLVPKGSKLTGHVTAAKARSKGDPDSQLTVTFDKLNITSGKLLSIKGMVQAVFPPQEEQSPNMSTMGTSQGGSMRGSIVGGGGVSPGGTGITNTKTGSDTESSSKPEPVADPKSVGVQGIDNLQLNDGVLTSKGKNVKLGNGVRMIVRADILG
jgi:hypothetical protein